MNSKTALRASLGVLKLRRLSSSHSSEAKKLSHMALSKQSPTEPIEGRTPAFSQRWPNARDVYWVNSSGCRNSSAEGVAMTTQKRRSDRCGRAPLRSPGRPPAARRENYQRFWASIAAGCSTEDTNKSRPTRARGPGSTTEREKLSKIALIAGIGPCSGALRLTQTRTNAAILAGCGERGAKARLAAGAE